MEVELVILKYVFRLQHGMSNQMNIHIIKIYYEMVCSIFIKLEVYERIILQWHQGFSCVMSLIN
jgi:hypothetical protein